MIWEKHEDLISLKKIARLTYRDFATALEITPGGVAQKFCGFVVLTPEERRIIEHVCKEAIDKQKSN